MSLCSHSRRMTLETDSPFSKVSHNRPSVTRPGSGQGALMQRSLEKLRPNLRRFLASVRRSVCAVIVCENCPRVSSRFRSRSAGTCETSRTARLRIWKSKNICRSTSGCRTFTATTHGSSSGRPAAGASASTFSPRSLSDPPNPNHLVKSPAGRREEEPPARASPCA